MKKLTEFWLIFAVQLLSEEYSAMSPGTLEAQGLINSSEYLKVAALTQSASPDAHKKIAGMYLFINNFSAIVIVVNKYESWIFNFYLFNHTRE